MRPQPSRIVLYLNQFFGQIGGEEVAGAPPRLSAEPVGSARALAAQLIAGEALAGVIICGDNYFAEHPQEATREILDLIRPLAPSVVLAGPAYNGGRYGVACGALCQAVGADLNIPTVTGMFRENPGVDLYRRATVILETGDNARTMAQDLGRMLAIARSLQAGEALSRPHEVGYFSRGIVAQERADRPAATRAVDMLLAKIGGQPYHTEVELPTFGPARAAPPVADLRKATVALVTDGGLVPAGNPDGIESRAATKFGIYPIEGRDRLDPADYDVSHGGYDTGFVKIDPHRLIPLDVAREIEHEGLIGHLFQNFLATTGLANPLENSRRLGREMAAYLREAGVDAVILTST